MATRSISELFFACSKVFNEELDALRLHGGVRMSKWDDEKGRLRIWASNIGAHQTGQSSLDFRLRDAPHIHQQLIDLLGDFIGAIYEIRAILSGPKNDHPQSTDFDDPDTSPYENPETEINHLHDSFVNIIDCLFHISMLVRKPARHKFPTYPELESQFEPIDTYHVTHKFLAANTVITQRLGRANTGRRVYLKRRERRRGKFGKDMGKIQDQTLSDTVATEFTDNGKDDSVSLGVTSYASSLQSGASPTIPPPPKQSAEQKPFECPFCFYIITIDNTYSWTEHIFQDLLPYICPYSDCPVPEKLYDNRHDWSDHLRSSHLTFYNDRVCPLCENITESGPQLERHLARHLEDLALFVLPVTDKDETTKDDTQMASPGIETIAENTEQDQIIEKEPAEPDVMDIDQPKQSRQKQANTGNILQSYL
ncbi:MAG: hypothetical protein LQ343_000103 [Gyalolechia ehrenbergii]|nr:MAG: hypothetical protein LQ343_000103 [Gyalolechia ehrenbergii]